MSNVKCFTLNLKLAVAVAVGGSSGSNFPARSSSLAMARPEEVMRLAPGAPNAILSRRCYDIGYYFIESVISYGYDILSY
jgi:hypothetical protein